MTRSTLGLATTLLATLTAAAAAAPSAAPAPKPLEVTVFTGSPGGFLVDSTLISGEHDAILIDAQFSLADAHRLVAQILESKKNLTAIYITHDHPDHYFGLAVLHAAFPHARLVALPATARDIRRTAHAKVAQWAPLYGVLVPAQPVLPEALRTPALELEGQTLEIHGHVQGDDADDSYVWIPSIRTVVAGDLVFRGVHPWTRDTTPAERRAWRASLDQLAALHPVTVIAGHKDPKLDDSPAGIAQTRDYLEAFDAAVASSTSAAEAERKVAARYADLQLPVILHLGAAAAFGH